MFKIDVVMTTDLVTVSPSDTLDHARFLMRQHRIRHLPVLDTGGNLVGLLSQTDVLAATDSFLREKDDRMNTAVLPVEDVMVTDITYVEDGASIRQAALCLERNRIGCLPVLNNGKLAGIVTDTDFVGICANLLETMEEGEPV